MSSITDTASLENYVYIPSAFTPNGEAFWDEFECSGKGIKTFQMYVFDRWGMKLGKSDDINQGWEGTNEQGKLLQEDTYLYCIQGTFTNGSNYYCVGRVTMIK